MFHVAIDQRRHFMHIRLWGFWTPAIMEDYLHEVRAQMAKLTQSGGCKYLLIDLSDFALQTQEIAEGHAQNLRIVKHRDNARVALVTQSRLTKLQSSRVAQDTGHCTFPTVEEAMAWLFAEEDRLRA